jgi:hypothetical protein
MIIALIVRVNENNYHLSMDDPNAWALLAGTLALMTHFAESRCPHGAERICENLLRLCAKLGARWSLIEEQARTSVDPGALRH